eukprot:15449818-Alexandrium_andersonii.AAC.1
MPVRRYRSSDPSGGSSVLWAPGAASARSSASRSLTARSAWLSICSMAPPRERSRSPGTPVCRARASSAPRLHAWPARAGRGRAGRRSGSRSRGCGAGSRWLRTPPTRRPPPAQSSHRSGDRSAWGSCTRRLEPLDRRHRVPGAPRGPRRGSWPAGQQQRRRPRPWG